MSARAGTRVDAKQSLQTSARLERRTVALVVENYPSDSPFLLAKFARLREEGIDAVLVCLSGGGRRATVAAGPVLYGWPVHSILPMLLLPVAMLIALRAHPRGTLRYLAGGARLFGIGVFRHFYLDFPLIRVAPDLIHFEFGPLAHGRMHLRSLLCARVVVSFRGYDLNFVALDDPGYYEEVWKHADSLHLLGEDLWRRAIRRGCPADVRHRLIPPAIDVDYFQAGRRDHGDAPGRTRPLRVVSVGRLVWKKGYEHGLEAIRRLRDRGVDVRYRIVGSGPYADAISHATDQLGLRANVEIVAGDQRLVKESLQWADVMLHPAVSEGFCNAVLEAQSMSLPVVCSDADGLAENVVDGVTGFVVPRRDGEAAANRLHALAIDGDLRKRMGAAGRERVVGRFRIEQQIAAFGELYDEVLGAPRAPEAHGG